LDKADFHLCQDGAVHPVSKERYAGDMQPWLCAEVFNASTLPNKFVQIREDNVGTAVQLCEAFQDRFAEGYKYVVVIGLDFEVSKFYVKSLLRIFEQFEKDERAGLLRTGLIDYPYRKGDVMTPKEAEEKQDLVDFVDGERSSDMGMWARSWAAIEPLMNQYIKIMRQHDYRLLIGTKWHGKHRELKPVVKMLEDRFGSIHEDWVPELALAKKGMNTLRTLVPRCRHFGDTGTMGRLPKFYYNLGFDRMPLYDVGNVERYHFPGEKPAPKPLPSGLKMVYMGVENYPFSIRGDKSRRVYYRVRRGDPIDVFAEDVPWLEKQGFMRL